MDSVLSDLALFGVSLVEKLRRAKNLTLATAFPVKDLSGGGDGYESLRNMDDGQGNPADANSSIGALDDSVQGNQPYDGTRDVELPPEMGIECRNALHRTRISTESLRLVTRPLLRRSLATLLLSLLLSLLVSVAVVSLLFGLGTKLGAWLFGLWSLILVGSAAIRVRFMIRGWVWLAVTSERLLLIEPDLSGNISVRTVYPARYYRIDKYKDRSGEIRFYDTYEEQLNDLSPSWSRKEFRLSHYPSVELLAARIYNSPEATDVARSLLDDDDKDVDQV